MRLAFLCTPIAPHRWRIMHQVQISAGILVVAGATLGFLAHPAFYALSAFVGAGLAIAGVAGWCGRALLLKTMPWNRRTLGV